jgi:phospholipid N-methyltransferase
MSNNKFITSALRDHKIGAVMPSSKYVVRKIVREILPIHRFIIEYGPGDGVITKGVLSVLSQDGKMVGLETNQDFVDKLGAITDNRLKVYKHNVIDIATRLEILGLPEINAVISGIPFSMIKYSARESVIANTYSSLTPGGIFIIYQFSPLTLPILKKYFKSVNVIYEVRNFLPYFIMIAHK